MCAPHRHAMDTRARALGKYYYLVRLHLCHGCSTQLMRRFSRWRGHTLHRDVATAPHTSGGTRRTPQLLQLGAALRFCSALHTRVCGCSPCPNNIMRQDCRAAYILVQLQRQWLFFTSRPLVYIYTLIWIWLYRRLR